MIERSKKSFIDSKPNGTSIYRGALKSSIGRRPKGSSMDIAPKGYSIERSAKRSSSEKKAKYVFFR